MSKGPKIKRIFENQRLFTPAVIRRYTNSSGILKNQTRSSLSGSAPASVTGSFRYDPPGSPLKSTQELPLDFSKFESHTFFSSAESNVNIVFDKIINQFPFDGTSKDYEDFLDELTGYEKFILDGYPSYTGYLTFGTGSATGAEQYIEVKDRAGVLFPTLSRIRSAKTILDPQGNSFSIECKLLLSNSVAGSQNQTIFQHMSTDGIGYSVFVKASSPGITSASVNFAIFSASNHISASYSLDKGIFHSLSFVYDKTPNARRALIFSGSSVIAESERFNFKSIKTGGSSLFIGSGSAISFGSSTFTPQQTFSGSIDELRIFSSVRKKSDIDYYSRRTMFARDDLKLSYRFNEPTGSYVNNDVVLDHSGMSLHARISAGFQLAMREKLSSASPDMLFEQSVKHPVLFPSYPTVLSLNNSLLISASRYDSNNPNLITKLIPQHYLDEAAASLQISTNPDGSLMDGLSSSASTAYNAPGGANLGQPQIISSLLFMWAREFDVIKAMIDHVSNLVFVDYESTESIADKLLPVLAEYYGLELPNMFRNSKMNQFFSGEEVVDGKVTIGLQFVQNEIWRRILINIREIISSKGTKHSIKAVFRSAGIDPDRIFRFVEYGGTKEQLLGLARERATEISSLLDFSGSLSFGSSYTKTPQGLYSNRPALQSVFLSGSRTQQGSPLIFGEFTKNTLTGKINGTTAARDGLMTSGSWTIEARVKFPIARSLTKPQSIFRLHTTSSINNTQHLLLNVVASPPTSNAVYAEKTGEKVTLYCRAGFYADAPLLEIPINIDIFDGKTWYISAGRKRCDEVGSHVSSSYFLRVARQDYGDLTTYSASSAFFAEQGASGQYGENLFQLTASLDPSSAPVINASGSFLMVGNQDIGGISVAGYNQLNDSIITTSSRATSFEGLWGFGRFWSKALDEAEAKEHILNFRSLGVKNPLVNFGFSDDVTGSFEKLRLDISTDQPETKSNGTGGLSLIDFSQNFNVDTDGALDKSGATLQGFAPAVRIIKPERFDFSFISPNYDEMPELNKVRVAGFTQGKNLFELGGLPAPVYEIPKSAEPIDDTRFGIEFSVMQALDEDIMNIFATLEMLDLALGAPELMFAEEYPDLISLRNVYFNRLTDSISYAKFFDFFRWLDESFNVIIENLIPRKTNYMGFNFIIEGHCLERPKVAYGSGDVYLGESTRRNLKGMILLRQLVGDMRKI